MGTKKFFNLLFLTALAVSTVRGDIPDHVKAVAALAVSGISTVIINKVQKNSSVAKAAKYAGLDPQDVRNVIGVSGTFFAASFFVNEKLRKRFQRFATRAPLAAGVSYLITRRSVRSVIKGVKGVGGFLVCPQFKEDAENGCQGICDHCMLTNGMIFAGTYIAIDQAIDSYYKRDTVENGNRDEDDDESRSKEELLSRFRCAQ